mgnify:CR=1 FL=1
MLDCFQCLSLWVAAPLRPGTQGASALSLQLGVSAQEAKQLIERFAARYGQPDQALTGASRLIHESGQNGIPIWRYQRSSSPFA